jgi:hypothetical protein
LYLSHVTDGYKSSTILGLITTALMDEGGMSKDKVAAKLVSCGFDGASIFQGTKTGVTRALQQGWAPFSIGIHYCSHRKNLAVQTLNAFSMVAKLEALM